MARLGGERERKSAGTDVEVPGQRTVVARLCYYYDKRYEPPRTITATGTTRGYRRW